MFRFIIKRLFYGLLVLFGVSTIVFFLFAILPGDPARMLMGQRADIASVEAIKKDLGLDKPVLVQYLNFLNDISPVSLHNTYDADSYWYLNDSKYGKTISLIHIGKLFFGFKKTIFAAILPGAARGNRNYCRGFPKDFITRGFSYSFSNDYRNIAWHSCSTF